jgi:hypothetical protein
MMRAWIYGFFVLFFIFGAWFLTLQLDIFSKELLVLVHISPFLAGLLSSYQAPRKSIFLGSSLAIPALILILLVNCIYQWIGKSVDFPNLKGSLQPFMIIFVYEAILCFLGSIVGYEMAKRIIKTKNL